MDYLTLVLAITSLMSTIIAGLVGWLVRSLFHAIEELKKQDAQMSKELTDLRVTLPERYVTKGDFKDSLDAIFRTLRSIETKLDRKVDKTHHP